MGAVLYLLHFTTPHYHARHYLGYTRELPARLARHRSGQGSPLIRAVLASGNDFTLARTWRRGTRTQERLLKNQKHIARYCPVCQEQAAIHAGKSNTRSSNTRSGLTASNAPCYA